MRASRNLTRPLNKLAMIRCQGSLPVWHLRLLQVVTVSPSGFSPSLHNLLIDIDTVETSTQAETKMSPQELDVSLEIWNDAYDRLKRQQPKIVEVYESILSGHLVQCKPFLY